MTMSEIREHDEVSQIKYQTDNQKLELFGMLKEYLAPVLPDRLSVVLRSRMARTLRDTLIRDCRICRGCRSHFYRS